MTKPKSYGITPRQTHANRNVQQAAHVVLGSFGTMIREKDFKALTEPLIKSSFKTSQKRIR